MAHEFRSLHGERIPSWCVAAAAALALTACAGGYGGSSPTPSSMTTSSPTTNALSTPTPNNLGPAPPGVLTPSPQPLVATSTSTNFSNVASGTVFPILATDPGSEGTVTVGSSGGLSLTGVTLPWESFPSAYSAALIVGETDLDYTRFGYWDYHDNIGDGTVADAVWNIGFVTPVAAIPASGEASYAGKTSGLYDETHPCGCVADDAAFAGDAALTANFGTRTITGSFTHLTITGSAGGYSIAALPPTLNDVSFTAAIDPTKNWFSGTTRPTSFPTGPQAFASNASGTITGMFYGPAANEVGGVWSLRDSVRSLVGAFGGKQ